MRYLPSGRYLAVEVAALGYALRIEPDDGEHQLVVRLAARAGLSLGLQF